MTTRAEFVAAMGLLYAAGLIEQRGNGLPPDSTARENIYFDMLRDIPGPILLEAAKIHIAESRWFPTIAEIRAHALALKHEAAGYVSAEIAWVEAMRCYDTHGAVQPSNRFVLEALRLAGGIWTARNSDQPTWVRKAYIDTYNALVERAQAGEDALPSSRELLRLMSQRRAEREAAALLPPGDGGQGHGECD